nr:HNH endonuclease [uncultured phage]CAI9752183.1 HNH endonuclease [uncultured phage]
MEEFKELICQKCGNTFKVGRDSKNKWIRRKLCSDCSDYQKAEKIVKCKCCGKDFTVYRTADNRHWVYNNYKCRDCIVQERLNMVNQTKTLVCQKCGKEFAVPRSNVSGNFLLRKYCQDCDNANKPYRLATCVTCGKEFKQYRTPCGGFSEVKYCSYECGLIQKKTKICSVCGKEFELTRSEKTGNFKDNGKYCSDECAKIGWLRLTKETCQQRYGVDLPCQSANCVNANPSIHSNINIRFGELLTQNEFEFIDDFRLRHYCYDFSIKNTNILIEINPTFTHTSKETGVYPALQPSYHHDKTKFALDNGYLCICVWDWNNWEDIINLIKQPNIQLEEATVQLHYSKQKDNVINPENEDELLSQGYLPIYDDGFKVII